MTTQRIKIENFIFAEKTRYYVFLAFLTLVFLTGGGARGDIQSLVFLRPLSFLFIAYALLYPPGLAWKGLSVILYLLVGLTLLLIVQLVPLPPVVWTSLPGREIFSNVAAIANLDDPWRPISLAPSRTLNSLFSLVVPFATIFLFAIQTNDRRKYIFWFILVLGGVSAALGLLQIIGPSNNSFYTYRITNNGVPVGLFSNRNHHAIFLASLVPAVVLYFAVSFAVNQNRLVQFAFGLIPVLFIISMVLATGSRAGLMLLLLSLMITVGGLYFFNRKQLRSKSGGPAWAFNALMAFGFLAVLSITYFVYNMSRLSVFDRLFGVGTAESSRFKSLPYLIELVEKYLPFGSGFGSFEFVFKAIEPTELLQTNYFNQAHNDGLQILIEGGVPAALLLLAFLFWFLRCSATIFNSAIKKRVQNKLGQSLMIGLVSTFAALTLLLGSVFDYPLRTPSMMAYFAILCCWIGITERRVGESKTN